MPIVKKDKFLDILQHREILTMEFVRLRDHLLKEVEKLNRSNEEAHQWVLKEKERLNQIKSSDSYRI